MEAANTVLCNSYRKMSYWRRSFLAVLQLPFYRSSFVLSKRTMPSSTSSRTIHSVAIVGGTHGNEYTGIFCVKALDRKLSKTSNGVAEALSFPFRLKTLIGNPIAYLQNKRFVDQDLNRQFSYKALATKNVDDTRQGTLSVEQIRAKELDAILGPKFGTSSSPGTDFIIDLHTTTANMGTALIVGQGDPITTQAAAYVMHKCKHKVCVLMHTHTSQEERPHLSSIAPHAYSIEVGPVPQGVLRHDKVEEMQESIDLTLEFLKRLQEEPQQLLGELKQYYPNGKVPCYRSAPAIRKGEMSAKLIWPSDPENENFPQWLVHKEIQDQDFKEIRTGDPLFVDLDGNVLPYDGSYGSPVLLMFINEGGYYYASSGTGVSVAQRDEYDLFTGELIPKETEQEKDTTNNSGSCTTASNAAS